MDYILGMLLIVAPWLLGLDYREPQALVPLILGAGILFYSLMTAYELGLVGAINMQTHLGLDLLGGIVLAASPWLFGFAAVVWIPHLVVGLMEIGAALMTKIHPTSVPHSGGTRPAPTR